MYLLFWPNLLLVYRYQILLLLFMYNITDGIFEEQYELSTMTPHYENLTKVAHRNLKLMGSRNRWQYRIGNLNRRQHDVLKTIWRKPRSANVDIVLGTQNIRDDNKKYQDMFNNAPVATQKSLELTTPESMIEFDYMQDHVIQNDGKQTTGNISVFRVEENHHSLFPGVFKKYVTYQIRKEPFTRFTTPQIDLKFAERKVERAKPKIPREAKYPNKINMHSSDFFPTDLPIKRVTIYQTAILVPITTKKSPPNYSNKSKKSLKDDQSRLHVSENKTLGSINIEAVHQRYPFKYHYQATVRSLTKEIENTPDEYRLYQDIPHREHSEKISYVGFSHNMNYKLNLPVAERLPDTTEFNIVPIIEQQLRETHARKTTAIPSDKVKFFEMYDENTANPSIQAKPVAQLGNLSQSHDLYSHVSFKNSSKSTYTEIPPYKMYSVDISEQATSLNTSVSNYSVPIKFPKRAKESSWSKFTYLAVYIYEPLSLHCDAAILSPHWLVTSGACLYLRQSDQSDDAVSAFVTYCGPNWRHPELVVYVKYSVVHPRFHPRDPARRQLYNIGLIQVADSTSATCRSWSAVSLVTHHAALGAATAVGWGLDRFHEATIDAAPSYFSSYNSNVYSGSCPGNKNYEHLKNMTEDQGGINNVFCLPPRTSASDVTAPAPGSVLVSGGKLVALYLEEERHPTGDQSAQYTGVWALAPWVASVAKETEDLHQDSVLSL
ncbi:uncharacterized protein LOC105384157 [Plutella xylostella]|uniref:uncharacterized protein LOC105384157 n=1 Tax=Plutella xylostella TaxID=51655 RepID=UPI0020327152|nr:uncharacterized protein LOC105384157 [Plutella xylostella]